MSDPITTEERRAANPAQLLASVGEKVELLSPSATADMIGLSTSTLAKWRITGAGPAFLKLGAKVKYDAAVVAAWIETRRRASTSDRAA